MITANIAVIACANPTQPGTVLAIKIIEAIAPGPAKRGVASGKTETSSFFRLLRSGFFVFYCACQKAYQVQL